MTKCLGKSCSFGLPRVPFVSCCQLMCLVTSLLVLRAGCGIWLYQFLIIAYPFTFHSDAGFEKKKKKKKQQQKTKKKKRRKKQKQNKNKKKKQKKKQ